VEHAGVLEEEADRSAKVGDAEKVAGKGHGADGQQEEGQE